MLDVDGVLTDGRLWFGADGEKLKAFHVRDGHGIKSLVAAGVGVAVISGRRSAAVTARMRELGVADVAQGVGDKARALAELLKRNAVDPRRVACLVDDTPDLGLMAARRPARRRRRRAPRRARGGAARDARRRRPWRRARVLRLPARGPGQRRDDRPHPRCSPASSR